MAVLIIKIELERKNNPSCFKFLSGSETQVKEDLFLRILNIMFVTSVF